MPCTAAGTFRNHGRTEAICTTKAISAFEAASCSASRLTQGCIVARELECCGVKGMGDVAEAGVGLLDSPSIQYSRVIGDLSADTEAVENHARPDLPTLEATSRVEQSVAVF